MQSATERFTLVLRLVQRAVAGYLARQARGPLVVLLGTRYFTEAVAPSPHRPIPVPVWNLLVARLDRLATRFTRLVQRWESGTLPKLRPGRAGRRAGRSEGRRAGEPTEPQPARPPILRLPRERGWINKRLPEAGNAGGLLHALMQWPEWPQFLAEVPRALRLIRPICHALATDLPPGAALPPRPRTPRRKRPAAPSLPPPSPTWRPIAPNILAAAKAWKKTG